MKRFYQPHTNRVITVGGRRKPDLARMETLRVLGFLKDLKAYKIDYTQIPANLNLSPKALPELRKIFLNNIYGDCFIAAMNHFEGTAVDNAGGSFLPTDQNITTEYSGACGFDPNDPTNTDDGCADDQIINYYSSVGYSTNGTKLLGMLAIDATNPLEVAAAIYLLGSGVVVCTGLPDAWIVNLENGTFADGFLWDVVSGGADDNNGHAYDYFGYASGSQYKTLADVVNAMNIMQFNVDTWAFFGAQTAKATAAYSTVYAILTPDVVAKGVANSPEGISWTQICSDFNVDFGGNVIVPPAPDPPAPAPTATFTIAASGAAGQGTITPNGDVTVKSGASQSFSIAALAGYVISEVDVDGVSQGAISTYTFENVTDSHTIDAFFAAVGPTPAPPAPDPLEPRVAALEAAMAAVQAKLANTATITVVQG